jgi:uncharacterized iron-regulated membrane protein
MVLMIMAIATITFGAVAGIAQKSAAQHPKITMKQARATALKAVPGAKIKSAELETEDGQFIYSFDMKVAGGVKEVWVDAMTGQVVKTQNETAADEKNEARQEKLERAHKK